MIKTDNDAIEKFLSNLTTRAKVRFVKWIPNKKGYPEYLFLSGDKGILAYVKFFVFKQEKKNDRVMCKLKLDEIIKITSLAFSELDRPILIIYLFNFNGFTDVLFETDEQIRDRLQNDCSSVDGLKNNYFPNIELMGDFDNLLSLLFKMKKRKSVI